MPASTARELRSPLRSIRSSAKARIDLGIPNRAEHDQKVGRRQQPNVVFDVPPLPDSATRASVRASDSYHPASRRSGVNRIATFVIGFVLGGAVVGGAIYLSDAQDDPTSGPIEQPEASGSVPAEDSPTPASSATDDRDASPTPTVAVATPVTEADELRIDGLGSMTIGMHVNDVER